MGGLLSATALNMVVLPALYWLYGERKVESGETPTETVTAERIVPRLVAPLG